VTVGNDGFINVTSDGKKWDAITGVTDKSLYTVIYENNKFVAAGADGEIIVSDDGYNWHKAKNNFKYTIKCMIYKKGVYIAGGYNASIFISKDGESWECWYWHEYTPGDFVKSITFDGKIFTAETGNYTLHAENIHGWATKGTAI
jgi:hypothetical protein